MKYYYGRMIVTVVSERLEHCAEEKRCSQVWGRERICTQIAQIYINKSAYIYIQCLSQLVAKQDDKNSSGEK